jgi:hypothetical protein
MTVDVSYQFHSLLLAAILANSFALLRDAPSFLDSTYFKNVQRFLRGGAVG